MDAPKRSSKQIEIVLAGIPAKNIRGLVHLLDEVLDSDDPLRPHGLLVPEVCALQHPVGGLERLENSQVWSLTQLHSVDFSQSRVSAKKCVFNKRTIKFCVSCF